MKIRWAPLAAILLMVACRSLQADGLQSNGSNSTLPYDGGTRWINVWAGIYNPTTNEQFWGVAGVSVICYDVPFSSTHTVTVNRSSTSRPAELVDCGSRYPVYNGSGQLWSGDEGNGWNAGYIGPDAGQLAKTWTHTEDGYDDSYSITRDSSPGRDSTTSVLPLSALFPEASPAREQRSWRAAYGDPAPAVSHPKLRWDMPPADPIPLRQVIATVAERGQINLIADDYGSMIMARDLPAISSLSEMLDHLCAPGPLEPNRYLVRGAFWRRVGDTYLLRSLNWPEQELHLIPHRWLAQWRESERRHGCISLDEIAEMASLDAEQIYQLTMWMPQAHNASYLAAPFRWYLRACPQLRARLQTPAGVALAELGVDYDHALQDLDPTDPIPVYVAKMRRVPPDRLHVSLIQGVTGDTQATGRPAVAVIFQEYEGGHPVGRRMAFLIRLFRP